MVKTYELPLQGARVPSLVGEVPRASRCGKQQQQNKTKTQNHNREHLWSLQENFGAGALALCHTVTERQLQSWTQTPGHGGRTFGGEELKD